MMDSLHYVEESHLYAGKIKNEN